MILSYQAHFYGQITIWRSSHCQDDKYYPFINYIFIELILKITFSTDCPSQIVIDTSPRSSDHCLILLMCYLIFVPEYPVV